MSKKKHKESKSPLKISQMQSLCVLVKPQLATLLDSANVHGAARLCHEVHHNLRMLDRILGKYVVNASRRSNDELRMIDRQAREFRELVLTPDEDFDK
jgi:hypothetical protein